MKLEVFDGWKTNSLDTKTSLDKNVQAYSVQNFIATQTENERFILTLSSFYGCPSIEVLQHVQRLRRDTQFIGAGEINFDFAPSETMPYWWQYRTNKAKAYWGDRQCKEEIGYDRPQENPGKVLAQINRSLVQWFQTLEKSQGRNKALPIRTKVAPSSSAIL